MRIQGNSGFPHRQFPDRRKERRWQKDFCFSGTIMPYKGNPDATRGRIRASERKKYDRSSNTVILINTDWTGDIYVPASVDSLR